MTTLEHYTRVERAAAADLARSLRRTASMMEGEARIIEDGNRPSDTAIRSDMAELGHVLRAYDKALAGLEAVKVAIAEKSEWP